MNGWILYKKNALELTAEDHGVHRLLAAATKLGIHLDVYKPEQFDCIVSQSDSQSDRELDTRTIFIDKISHPVPDLVIPRIGAESSYMALAITRQLEQLGVFVCNSSASIAAVKDKMYMSQKLMGCGLPTPKTMLVKFPISIDMVQRALGFPVVIKTIAGAKGFGVHLCESAAQLKDLMELISTLHSPQGIILQEFVASSYGRDLRVFVLNGQVVGCMKRTSLSGFKANYSLGGAVELFPATPEIERLALASARLFGLGITGIDLLFKPEGFTVCEANSSPGFKGMEQATGADIATQIVAYLQEAVLSSRRKKV